MGFFEDLEIAGIKKYIAKNKCKLQAKNFKLWEAFYSVSETVAKQMGLSEFQKVDLQKAMLTGLISLDIMDRLGLKRDNSNLHEIASKKGNTKEFYEASDYSKLSEKIIAKYPKVGKEFIEKATVEAVNKLR